MKSKTGKAPAALLSLYFAFYADIYFCNRLIERDLSTVLAAPGARPSLGGGAMFIYVYTVAGLREEKTFLLSARAVPRVR